MVYNPDCHHRHSIRLLLYDYSQEGQYFITVCTQNREHWFGEVIDGEMVLNPAGKLVRAWWLKLSDKFPVALHEFIIMSNHIHGILEIAPVGANPCVCPEFPCVCPEFIRPNPCVCPCYTEIWEGGHMGPPQRVPPQRERKPDLPEIIQWFKTMTTNEYIRLVKQNQLPPFGGRLWQRNYYEHIIRDERDYWNTVNYIKNNPKMWGRDRNNLE